MLSQTDNPEKVLQQVARQIEKISDNIERNNIAASTGIIAGLVLNMGEQLRLIICATPVFFAIYKKVQI